MDHPLGVLAGSVAACSIAALTLAGTSGCLGESSNRDSGTGGGETAAGGNEDAAPPPVGGEGEGEGEGGAYPLPDEAEQSGFFTWTYHGQPVGFFLPEATGEPLPVVMFLHGCGNDPVTPNWWIIDALNRVEPCAVLLPFRPRDESPTCSAWGGTYDDELRPAMVDALAGLDSVVAEYGLDGERQYLYGESMGGEGVLKLLVELPTRFAGAIVADGYVDDTTGAERMAQTPLWLLHGTADEIAPLENIDTLYQAIRADGGSSVKLTLYDGMEHSPAIVRARSEPGLLEWLLAQRHDGT